MNGDDITVVIPTHPGREDVLERAVRSAHDQTVKPADVIVQLDETGAGAGPTRNAALAKVNTEWVAFLDSDDRFHPDHLETLIGGANKSGADLISTYPEPDRGGLHDELVCCYKGIPVKGPVNIAWGPEQLDHLDTRKGWICEHCKTPRSSYIMVTNLVRMELVREIGGFPAPGSMGEGFAGYGAEDYLFLLALLDAGARFHHVTGVRTWTYRTRGD